ncbi:MAG: SDR family oxidoreductase [Thermaerobacterales bacterium]
MDLGLNKQIALVAAASQGLGKAVARRLSQEGAEVAICSRSKDAIHSAAEDIAAQTGNAVFPYAADLTDEQQVREWVGAAVNHFGGLDIMVANCGGPPPGAFEELSADQWRKSIEMNLMSTVYLCQESVPYMKQRGGGRIVTITSIAARQPIPGLIHSTAARAGVLGLCKGLANELAPYNILVNSLCPGFTRTERIIKLARTRMEQEGISEAEAYAAWEQQIPLGRLGEPEEFADMAAFLCSARSSYITGAVIPIDGGWIQGI